MPRIDHWERHLIAAIEAARDRPFRWGRHDCATFAFDLRRDLTGGFMHRDSGGRAPGKQPARAGSQRRRG